MLEKELKKIMKKVEKKNTINLEENVVIKVFCNAILKTGKNIGCQCGNNVFENGKCKRHLHLSIPSVSI